MIPLPPEEIRDNFAAIRDASLPDVHDLVDRMEARLLCDEALLALQEKVDKAVGEISLRILTGGRA